MLTHEQTANYLPFNKSYGELDRADSGAASEAFDDVVIVISQSSATVIASPASYKHVLSLTMYVKRTLSITMLMEMFRDWPGVDIISLNGRCGMLSLIRILIIAR